MAITFGAITAGQIQQGKLKSGTKVCLDYAGDVQTNGFMGEPFHVNSVAYNALLKEDQTKLSKDESGPTSDVYWCSIRQGDNSQTKPPITSLQFNSPLVELPPKTVVFPHLSIVG